MIPQLMRELVHLPTSLRTEEVTKECVVEQEDTRRDTLLAFMATSMTITLLMALMLIVYQ